ncbi:hypothetical protein [Streptomyces sp. NPDC091040]|uniref:hypothetical protein n=1 Tax=Streptomyces sp. NPDC091040 TaxID=3365972 RepID=UPI0038199746
MPSALVVGYDPQAIPGVDGNALRAALEAELARFADHGIDAAMTERPWDVVVIGGGIRKAAPQAVVAFNTTGGDSVEAAQRWL